MKFKPFKNESQSLCIGGITVENRLDRVSCYGSIDITKDLRGLADALELQRLINDIVTELKSTKLPDCIDVEEPVTVKNPLE